MMIFSSIVVFSDTLLTDRDILISSRTISPATNMIVPTRGQVSRSTKRLTRQSFSEGGFDSESLLLEKTKQLESAENKLKVSLTSLVTVVGSMLTTILF
jgi:hypothetical protein